MLQDRTRQREEYWNQFYGSREAKKLMLPSQFACFVAQEAGDANLIIDIGCGTGRDSFFFARHGFQVVGIDGANTAIEKCSATRDELSLHNLTFSCSSVGDANFISTMNEARKKCDGPAIAYARFFLHAITDDEEYSFLSAASQALCSGDRLAMEYRTVRDASGAKVTAAHYRRFVDPSDVFVTSVELNFSVDYATEGFGFAKYGADDAYVARCILRKK